MTINTTNYINTSGINSNTGSTLEKIATGLAINKASDNAAGLAIADQLGAQKNTLSQAIENTSSGIAMSNIAQGAIASQKSILENINQLTLKANNGTVSEEGRQAIADEINRNLDEYERIADSTNYNGESLLKTAGDATDDLTIIGEGGDVTMQKADTTSISDSLRTQMADFVTNSGSRFAMLDIIDSGLDTLSAQAGAYGSAANALESMTRNYMTTQTNVANAESQIRDTDLAEMFTELNKQKLQTQTGFYAQAQANAMQGNVLALLS